MKKNLSKKLLSITLACVMLACLSFSNILSVANADASTLKESYISIVENGDGTYKREIQTKKIGNNAFFIEKNIGDIYNNTNDKQKIFLQVQDDIFIPVDHYSLSSDDENFVEKLNALDISVETRNLIFCSYSDLSVGDRIAFNIYLPKQRNARATTVERTTYVGYRDQTYYQEYYTTEYMTEQSKVIYNKNMGDNTQYLRQQFTLIGASVIGYIADFFTGGTISLVNLMANLFQSDASATKVIDARLHEVRYEKITFFVQVDGVKSFGANVSMANNGFIQLVEQTAMVGVTNTEKIFLSQRKKASWDNAQDQLAYSWWIAGGISEGLGRVSFGGQSFG